MAILTRRTLGMGAFAALFAASLAVAQSPQSVRVRGTIDKVDGQTLTVKSRDGSTLTIKLADNPRVTALVKTSLADIKVGDFIGVTAMPQPDGSQKAIGLHIFMAAQRGVVPAKFLPWDREPGRTTMTNADVKSSVASIDGQILMVKYSDGEKKIIVPPNTSCAVRPGQHGRPEGRSTNLHYCRTKDAGRNDHDAGDQCRPRWRRTTDVSDHHRLDPVKDRPTISALGHELPGRVPASVCHEIPFHLPEVPRRIRDKSAKNPCLPRQTCVDCGEDLPWGDTGDWFSYRRIESDPPLSH